VSKICGYYVPGRYLTPKKGEFGALLALEGAWALSIANQAMDPVWIPSGDGQNLSDLLFYFHFHNLHFSGVG
jgi:hypothetical protein